VVPVVMHKWIKVVINSHKRNIIQQNLLMDHMHTRNS